MRKTLEILRLKQEHGLSERAIAGAVSVARSTVQETLKRFAASALTWPLPADLGEDELHARLYPPAVSRRPAPLPDWDLIERELSTKGMTLMLLWQEFKAAHPDGLQYSAFCERFATHRKNRDAVLRRNYRPGEKLFIDFAGPTVPVTDRATGETRPASIFAAVLGYSNLTFACATTGQTASDWLSAQRRALEYFGGVPAVIVPDNPKALIARACRYEPDLNPAYQDFARHYGTAVVPARVSKPRDKAKAEGGVLIVERWILACLRKATFFSLAELNAAIAGLLKELNAKPFKKLPGNRFSRFEADERAALKPLPGQAYEYAHWKKVRVQLDYHVEIERRYYSVPSALIGKQVDARIGEKLVELFHHGKPVARHIKSRVEGAFITEDGHRPPKHRAVIELNHERLTERALAIGPATAQIIGVQWRARLHPEQTLRRSLGILRLARDFDAPRLEAACRRALDIGALSYRAIRGLIEAGPAIVVAATPNPSTQAELAAHENLRGAAYFR